MKVKSALYLHRPYNHNYRTAEVGPMVSRIYSLVLFGLLLQFCGISAWTFDCLFIYGFAIMADIIKGITLTGRHLYYISFIPLASVEYDLLFIRPT